MGTGIGGTLRGRVGRAISRYRRAFGSVEDRSRSCGFYAPATADTIAVGSCAFLLARHGDLRIEWEDKDHDAIIKLIPQKMAEGMCFFEVDYSGLEIVPIIRRSPTGRHVIVHDETIKAAMEAGFFRFPTTKFEGVGQIKQLGLVHDPEEVARTHTIAVPALQSFRKPAPGITVMSAAELADRLNGPEMLALVKPMVERKAGSTGPPDLVVKKDVLNWIDHARMPILPAGKDKKYRVRKAVVFDWLYDERVGIDPLTRLIETDFDLAKFVRNRRWDRHQRRSGIRASERTKLSAPHE